MGEEEMKKHPSLPPDYVTIAMLRERWLQKQEEQTAKEEQEQKMPEETQKPKELGVCHRSKDERVDNDGRELGLIQEKGKGKEIEIASSENGNVLEKRYHGKKKRNGAGRGKENGEALKVKMEGTEKGQNLRGKEGHDLDEKKNWCGRVDIISRNKMKVGITGFSVGENSGTQGTGEIMSACTAELLPKNGVGDGTSEILTAKSARRVGFSGGFRRNENNRDAGFRGKGYRIKVKESKDSNDLGEKMGDEVLQIDRKENGKKWRRRRGNGDKFEKCRAEVSGLKVNEVEPKSENECLEVGCGRDGMNGPRCSTYRNETKQNEDTGDALNALVVLENKVEFTVLVEKSRNDGYGRCGTWRGSLRKKFGNFIVNDVNERNKSGGNWRSVNSRRFEVDRKMLQRDSGKVWVKKEQLGAVAGQVGSMEFSRDHE